VTDKTPESEAEGNGGKIKFGLTERELEVLSTVAAGLSNKEAAAYWDIKEQTVQHHLCSIYDKMGVSTRLEAVTMAIHHGVPLLDVT